jgi:hypothetical protein
MLRAESEIDLAQGITAAGTKARFYRALAYLRDRFGTVISFNRDRAAWRLER